MQPCGDIADPTMDVVPGGEDDWVGACANCGKHGSDTVKLKNCASCHLVKYCSVDCQKAHRKQHKRVCKQRAAELRDERLFGQRHQTRAEEDFCPICTLPIPLRMQAHSVLNPCCMKRICNGCNVAAQRRHGMHDCSFCRMPCPKTDADKLAMIQARVEKKDPVAIDHLGEQYCHGTLGFQKDMSRAAELWTEAADLGSVAALFNLGLVYINGTGVQQDKAKGALLYEKAAMLGHVESRYNLGMYEGEKRNYDRAFRHWVISAKMGHQESVENIKRMFMGGVATKEQYTETLKGYQDAVEKMKSHDRDEANKRLGY